MNKNNLLDNEIKSILEEDSSGIRFSDELQNKILNSRKIILRKRINNFLDKEIEIPIAPALVGLAALLAIWIIPKGIFESSSVQVINIGESQIFIREEKDVSRK